MPLTLAGLVREVGLTVHVDPGPDRPVAWVHSTELADPTPFLAGGELLLTTGIALGPHRAYVRRLVDAGAAGLGFGTGLSHDHVPAGLVEAAREAGLPLVEVPREIPFIAITKAVSRAVAADEYATLARTSDAQRVLTRAALTSAAAVVRRLAGLVRGAVGLLDAAGDPVHVHGDLPDLRPEAQRLGPGPAGAAWRAGDRHLAMQALGRPGYLAVATAAPLDPADRTVVDTAASLLTLALARSDDVDVVRRELRTARFRLLLAGVPVPDAPTGPFRVFVLPKGTEQPPGFWAEHDGHVVVLAAELDRPAHASSPVDASEVARGYREALRARDEHVATFEEVPGAGLLAADAARHAETLLAPLDARLRDSLRVWLACHGQWDRAAARLGVHRNTIRNRVRRAEELLGRSLDSPGLRAELWFALHAGQ
ncbi:PucR family transcriptional regulator [Saccharothrix australiensis]|uniref:Purine catabolism regulator n=1 Tax=Saccharothrix australiensis TaxID=2072 RepID=A0A495W569_9PSEU|nr:PucR family transcriptional regulator [Saccharothrix australiensis]RKT56280.1 purine catabolism regulator [Saccharothrix australiensis]